MPEDWVGLPKRTFDLQTALVAVRKKMWLKKTELKRCS
jgi:hypothetical protein